MRSRKRKARAKTIAANIILAAVVIIIMLVIIELIGRSLYDKYLEKNDKTREDMEMYRFFEQAGYAEFGGHRLSRLTPGLDTPYFMINDAGFRGPNSPSDEKKNVFVMGGSTVFGVGVDDNETIAAFLQECLDKKEPGTYNVMNAGVTGYTTSEEMIFALREIRFLNPDSIVFIDGRNDIYYSTLDSWTTTESHPAIPAMRTIVKDDDPIINTNKIKRSILRLLQKSDFMKFIYYSMNKNSIFPAEPKYRPEAMDLMLFNWKTAEKVLGDEGVKTYFFLQPTLALHEDESSLTETEERNLKKMNEQSDSYSKVMDQHVSYFSRIAEDFNYTDITGALENLKSTKYLDDCHYTRNGNKVIAYNICKEMT